MKITNEAFDRLEGIWENRLNGEWQDDFGWNFISQPKLGKPGPSDFDMRFDQMREKITFEKLGGPPARNVGISGEESFWQAMKYEVSILTPAGQGIHHEMGHFLLNVLKNGDTADGRVGHVLRQATIPRANAMMTAGKLDRSPVINVAEDIYGARPQADEQALQEQIDAAFATIQSDVSKLGGPSLDGPLNWLSQKLPGAVNGPDWVFAFRHDKNPSQMAHGQRVTDPVGIGNLLSDFWIGRRDLAGATIDILQYAQKVDLIFHRMEWPHMAVNTMIKQP